MFNGLKSQFWGRFSISELKWGREHDENKAHDRS